MSSSSKSMKQTRVMAVATLLGVGMLTGCTAEYAGQNLPSPYYLHDDVQYFNPGAEFKLSREAAALEEQKASIDSQRQGL